MSRFLILGAVGVLASSTLVFAEKEMPIVRCQIDGKETGLQACEQIHKDPEKTTESGWVQAGAKASGTSRQGRTAGAELRGKYNLDNSTREDSFRDSSFSAEGSLALSGNSRVVVTPEASVDLRGSSGTMGGSGGFTLSSAFVSADLNRGLSHISPLGIGVRYKTRDLRGHMDVHAYALDTTWFRGKPFSTSVGPTIESTFNYQLSDLFSVGGKARAGLGGIKLNEKDRSGPEIREGTTLQTAVEANTRAHLGEKSPIYVDARGVYQLHRDATRKTATGPAQIRHSQAASATFSLGASF